MGERERNKTEQVSRFGANVPCGAVSSHQQQRTWYPFKWSLFLVVMIQCGLEPLEL